MSSTVVSQADPTGVVTVTVDNPPVNAMDDPTLAELKSCAQELAANDQARAVVVTGGNDRFLAGADLEQLREDLQRPGGISAHLAARGRNVPP